VVRLISTGEAFRPQVHVDDLVELTARLLDRDEAGFAAIAGHPVNVGANEANYTIRGLADLIASRVSGASVRLDDGAWVDRRSYRVRFDRLQQLVPEVPIRRVEEAIEPLVAQYRRVALADGDVRELRYTRLQQLRQLRLDGVLDDNLRGMRSRARQTAIR
jgi:nucleoside-diphosphate-sugar epimerase